jgi:hypothetical protein
MSTKMPVDVSCVELECGKINLEETWKPSVRQPMALRVVAATLFAIGVVGTVIIAGSAVAGSYEKSRDSRLLQASSQSHAQVEFPVGGHPLRFSIYWAQVGSKVEPVGRRLQMTATVAGVQLDGLMLDTGSATLAICPQPEFQSDNVSCLEPWEKDGARVGACELYGSSPPYHGFIGDAFEGEVQAAGLNFSRTSFLNMTQAYGLQDNECGTASSRSEGAIDMDGIFGFAFTSENNGYVQMPSSGWELSIIDDGAACPAADKPGSIFRAPAPWQQLLGAQDGGRSFGIFYSGTFGEDSGRLLVGTDANSYASHIANPAVSSTSDVVWAELKVALGGYNIAILSVTLEDDGRVVLSQDTTNRTAFDVTDMIVDTGTPLILLPPMIYDAIEKIEGDLNVIIAVTLQGIDSNVKLSLPVDRAVWTSGIFASDSSLILGLPIWEYYRYIHFDIDDGKIGFFSKQLFN